MSYQHKGIGSRLLCEAEKICYKNGIENIAIISGVGVREFYRKKGYTLKNNYMVKNFDIKKNFTLDYIIILCISVLLLSILYDLYN